MTKQFFIIHKCIKLSVSLWRSRRMNVNGWYLSVRALLHTLELNLKAFNVPCPLRL